MPAPATTRGVFYTGNRTVEVREVPLAKPGPGQVLVRMRAAAVCGSDLHRYRLPKENLGNILNVVAGHEPCGEVAAIGEGVRCTRVGDRVVVFHRLGCGTCEFCRSGEIGYCRDRRSHGGQVHGGDADYTVTDEQNCLPLPDDFSFVTGAVLACNGGTAYMGVRKLGAAGGKYLAVSGLGPVGLCAVLVAKAMGAWVAGIDVSEGRLALAKELGADAVVDAGRVDVVPEMQALTGGRGPDLAIETSGNPRAQKSMLDFLAFRGKACIVGLGGGQGLVNLSDLINKQATVFGSSIFNVAEYYEMIEFLRRTKVDFERVVTHRFTIEQAPEAFRLADSAVAGKAVFVWD